MLKLTFRIPNEHAVDRNKLDSAVNIALRVRYHNNYEPNWFYCLFQALVAYPSVPSPFNC